MEWNEKEELKGLLAANKRKHLSSSNEVQQMGPTSHSLWYSDRLHYIIPPGCSIFVANHITTSAGSSIM